MSYSERSFNQELVDSTPGVVVAVVPDVFFSVTVRNAVRSAGFEAQMVKAIDDLTGLSMADAPRLVVVDLGAVRGADDWATISGVERTGVPVLVFGPHKNVEGFRAAKAAGVTRVVSNGQFHGDMVGYITRYARGTATHEAAADSEQGEVG